MLGAGVVYAGKSPEIKLEWENKTEEVSWKTVLDEKGKDVWIVEQIPETSSDDNFSNLLVVQEFKNQKKTSSEKFAKGLFKLASKDCEGLRINGPKSNKDNGYEVSYVQIYCGKRIGTDYGTETFQKVIKIGDLIYVVTREFRVPPNATGGVTSFSKDKMEEMMAMMKAKGLASNYLVKDVFVCGGKSKNEKCPDK
tara:strand:- start:46855 stop:47442 length:588 start_codon:yes stop_codon:yes gene_type:complete